METLPVRFLPRNERTEETMRSVGADSASAAENMRAVADAVREQDTAVHQVADRIQCLATDIGREPDRRRAFGRAVGHNGAWRDLAALAPWRGCG